MITVDYQEICECIEKLDESIRLVTQLDDISIAEAIDNLYEVKFKLQTNLESFEDMVRSMGEEYDEGFKFD